MSAGTASMVTVSVTQEHIDAGKPRTCWTCPIALAITAAIPGTLSVDVMNPDLGFALIIGDDGSAEDMQLPIEARDFILRFDAGLPVDPFTFTAEVSA